MKKILNVLLAVILMFTFSSNVVFAEDADPVAKIGETTYTDLRYALTACETGQTVELLKDITLTGSWEPFADFKGTLDGKGHAINNLDIDSNGSKLGFFDDLKTTIKDITFNNPTIVSSGNVEAAGIVAGDYNATATNVTINNASINIANGEHVGGLVGISYGTIKNCKVNNSTIISKDQVGGLIGYFAAGTVNNNELINNTIEATSERAGGVVGKIQFSKGGGATTHKVNNNIINGGSVKAPDYAGGIAGQLMGDEDNCEARNNSINVTLSAPKTSPIAVLRKDQPADFTAALSSNLTNNTWTVTTYPVKTYVYTAEETKLENDQIIYNGVYDNNTLQIVLDNACEDTTIVLKENSQGYGTVYLRNNLKNAIRTLKNVVIKAEEGKTINISQITTQENIDKTLNIDGLTIDGLQFKNLNNVAILLDGGSEEGNAKPSAKNIIIKNNTFDNCKEDNVQISGYQIDGTNKFTNNTFKNMTGRFVTIGNAANTASFVFENNIVNNPKAYDSDGTIIKITGTKGFTVSDTNNDWDSGEYTSQEQTTWNSIGPIAKASYFTFVAPTDLKYKNTAKTVNLTTTKTTLGKVTIKYYDSEGNPLASAPKDAGTYNVKIDVAASNKTIAAQDVTDPSWAFTIAKREVTLTSGSGNKKYDGSAFTNKNVTVSGDGFVNGQGATYDVSGTITDVGTTKNEFTYTLNQGTNESNYNIEKVEGDLLIAKREVTLTSGSATKFNDETPLTNKNVTVSGDGFAQNEGATYNVTGSQSGIGSSINDFEYTLNATTKASNYNINLVKGILSVTATIDTTKSKNVTIDGNKLTSSFTKGTSSDIAIDIDDTYDATKTKAVLLNEKEEPVCDCITAPGSILVTVPNSFISTLSAGNNKYSMKVTNGDGINYYYDLSIKINAPTPSPTPSPGKDESCEKVIGPTWHWNNKKGICEDGGSVHTYSR